MSRYNTSSPISPYKYACFEIILTTLSPFAAARANNSLVAAYLRRGAYIKVRFLEANLWNLLIPSCARTHLAFKKFTIFPL
jgi:hypothetical protein